MTDSPQQPSSSPAPSLARAREVKIEELSRHFANDDLSLDDLERRIERVYKSVTLSELDSITADLSRMPSSPSTARDRLVAASAPMSVDTGIEVGHSRMLAIMSSTRRVGRWAAPRSLDIVAVMSDTRIDLTNAVLPIGGVMDIDIHALMASARIIVPPGMRVVNQVHSIMADVRSDADEVGGPGSSSMPVVRLRGAAVMSNIRVSIRRREEPIEYDDD